MQNYVQLKDKSKLSKNFKEKKKERKNGREHRKWVRGGGKKLKEKYT